MLSWEEASRIVSSLTGGVLASMTGVAGTGTRTRARIMGFRVQVLGFQARDLVLALITVLVLESLTLTVTVRVATVMIKDHTIDHCNSNTKPAQAQ